MMLNIAKCNDIYFFGQARLYGMPKGLHIEMIKIIIVSYLLALIPRWG